MKTIRDWTLEQGEATEHTIHHWFKDLKPEIYDAYDRLANSESEEVFFEPSVFFSLSKKKSSTTKSSMSRTSDLALLRKAPHRPSSSGIGTLLGVLFYPVFFSFLPILLFFLFCLDIFQAF